MPETDSFDIKGLSKAELILLYGVVEIISEDRASFEGLEPKHIDMYKNMYAHILRAIYTAYPQASNGIIGNLDEFIKNS